MSHVPSIFNRPRLDTDLPPPPALAVSGTLPDYDVGVAYSERLQIQNAIGKCTVSVLASDLPDGALVYVDNLTSEVVVRWPAFSLSATGLLQNGGFEEGSVGWALSGPWAITNTGDAEEGTYSAEFRKGTSGEFKMVGAAVPVSAPRTIVISGRVQQGASSAGNAGAGVGLRWYGPGATETDTVGPMVESGSGGAWNPAAHSGTAPTGATRVAPLVRGFRNRENKALWVDNITWDHSYFPGSDGEADYSLSVRVRDSAGRTADWTGTIGADLLPARAVWSASLKGSGVTLSGGNLVADSSDDLHVVVADRSMSCRHYWEITLSAEAGYTTTHLGIVGDAPSLSPGYEAGLSGAGANYAHINPRDSFFYPGGFGAPDTPINETYRFAFDAATGKFWIGSASLGWFFDGDPATGANETFLLSPSDTYRPAVVPRYGVTNYATVTANFGASAFLSEVPFGYEGGITTDLGCSATDALHEEVMADLPWAYWRLGEAVGPTTFLDFSGNARHLTVISSVVAGTTGLVSDGTAADFQTGYITTPGNAYGAASEAAFGGEDVEFTVMTVVRPDSTASAAWFLHMGDLAVNGSQGLFVGFTDDGTIRMQQIIAGIGYKYADSSAGQVVASETQMVHAVRTGIGIDAQGLLYKNGRDVTASGVQLVHGPIGMDAGSEVRITLGGLNSGGSFVQTLDGKQQHVVIYDHALSNERIITHYLASGL